MLKIILCDDDNISLCKIKGIIEKYFMGNDIEYTLRCVKSRQDVESSGVKNYNLFILDVELAGENGIDLGKVIRENNPDAVIVYISSYISYSPAGYKVKAFDYILKNDPNFERTVCACLDRVLEEMFFSQEKIRFKIGREDMFFLLKNIIYIESERRKVVIHTLDNFTYETYARLSDIEKSLSDKNFFRIQKSFIVNVKHIKRITGYNVYMTGGAVLKSTTSSERYRRLQRAFAKNAGSI